MYPFRIHFPPTGCGVIAEETRIKVTRGQEKSRHVWNFGVLSEMNHESHYYYSCRTLYLNYCVSIRNSLCCSFKKRLLLVSATLLVDRFLSFS